MPEQRWGAGSGSDQVRETCLTAPTMVRSPCESCMVSKGRYVGAVRRLVSVEVYMLQAVYPGEGWLGFLERASGKEMPIQ